MGDTLLCLSTDNHLDQNILPYLHGHRGSQGKVAFVGHEGKGFNFGSFYVSTLLQHVDPLTDAVIVPEAPIRVLQHFGQMLHTGR